MKKPCHLRVKTDRQGRKQYYFEPSESMKKAGYHAEPLGDSYAAAAARVENLNAEWDKQRREVPAVEREVQAGNFSWLIDRFQRDATWYGAKAPRTKEQIDACLKIVEATFGQGAVKLLQRKHARAFYNKVRIEGSVHKAQRVMKWFQFLLNYAVETGVLEYNPARGMKIESPEPRKEVWKAHEIVAVIDAAQKAGTAESGNDYIARPSIALAVSITYDTSLPQQDILALKWDQYDGEGLTVEQKKKRGNRNLYLPLSDSTRAMLSNGGDTEYIITNETTGKRYKDRVEFGKVFRKTKARAGIDRRITFHDIRRTVLTELGNRGATHTEIASMSGHAVNSPILRVYVRPDREAAKRAVRKRQGA